MGRSHPLRGFVQPYVQPNKKPAIRLVIYLVEDMGLMQIASDLPLCASPLGRLGPFPTRQFTELSRFTLTPFRVRIPSHQMKVGHKAPLSFGGEGGIRTHVPLRTTAFRVRLVMTTSILLRVLNTCKYNRIEHSSQGDCFCLEPPHCFWVKLLHSYRLAHQK